MRELLKLHSLKEDLSQYFIENIPKSSLKIKKPWLDLALKLA